MMGVKFSRSGEVDRGSQVSWIVGGEKSLISRLIGVTPVGFKVATIKLLMEGIEYEVFCIEYGVGDEALKTRAR